MKFGERLSVLRKQKALSQESLAEQLGVSRQAVSKWETGEAFPELSKLDALCRIFQVSPNFLMGYEENRAISHTKEEKSKEKSHQVTFWLIVACMGFVASAFCLGWAISHPVVYNGIDGLYGSLLGNDSLGLFIIGSVIMVFGLGEAYFDISGRGRFSKWIKRKMKELSCILFDNGNALK